VPDQLIDPIHELWARSPDPGPTSLCALMNGSGPVAALASADALPHFGVCAGR